jgi:tetratricopeptide (TPR) repeat protein
MTPRTSALLTLAILSTGCASAQKASWAEVQPPVAYLETLPPGALVTVDGIEVGLGPLAFPVPDEAHAYAIRVTSAGFEPLEASFAGSKLAGARIELVLRPEGFGSQRQLASGEPAGLLQAAVALLRANRPKDAITYAKASLAAGDSPQGHKVCGQAYRRMGNRDLAIKEYSLYLSLSPDAPDRKAIEEAITATSKDIEMTPPKLPLD